MNPAVLPFENREYGMRVGSETKSEPEDPDSQADKP